MNALYFNSLEKSSPKGKEDLVRKTKSLATYAIIKALYYIYKNVLFHLTLLNIFRLSDIPRKQNYNAEIQNHRGVKIY